MSNMNSEESTNLLEIIDNTIDYEESIWNFSDNALSNERDYGYYSFQDEERDSIERRMQERELERFETFQETQREEEYLLERYRERMREYNS